MIDDSKMEKLVKESLSDAITVELEEAGYHRDTWSILLNELDSYDVHIYPVVDGWEMAYWAKADDKDRTRERFVTWAEFYRACMKRLVIEVANATAGYPAPKE